MNVIYVTKGKMRIVDIPMTVEALKEAVGGWYRIISMGMSYYIVCNKYELMFEENPTCEIHGNMFYGNLVIITANEDKKLIPMNRVDLELLKSFVKPPHYYDKYGGHHAWLVDEMRER